MHQPNTLELALRDHKLASDLATCGLAGLALPTGRASNPLDNPILRRPVLLRQGQRTWFGAANWEGMPKSRVTPAAAERIRPVLLRTRLS
ncbi:MAG: hypothetical protein KC910_28990 [Candidatus Eremiobacteraeota bacterium]|nr:hypothetical protein [Candidatus Eremiobacteraeota bacterium]